MKTYRLNINGKDYEVCVKGIEGGRADVTVGGVSYDVRILGADAQQQKAVHLKESVEKPAPAPSAAQKSLQPGVTITSPLPGTVLKVSVSVGAHVRRGEQLAVVEAMKMENEILSETDGVVKEIFVSRADAILEGDRIMRIE